MSVESKPLSPGTIFLLCLISFVVGNRLGYSAALEKATTPATQAP